MILQDARVWFRYRCKITAHIKGNKSSMYNDNMVCILHKIGENETQKHMEKCDFTKEIRENFDMGKEDNKLVKWRK